MAKIIFRHLAEDDRYYHDHVKNGDQWSLIIKNIIIIKIYPQTSSRGIDVKWESMRHRVGSSAGEFVFIIVIINIVIIIITIFIVIITIMNIMNSDKINKNSSWTTLKAKRTTGCCLVTGKSQYLKRTPVEYKQITLVNNCIMIKYWTLNGNNEKEPVLKIRIISKKVPALKWEEWLSTGLDIVAALQIIR